MKGGRVGWGRTGTLNSFRTISSSSHRPSSISGIVYSILRHFLPTLERSRGGGWRAGSGESGRNPALGCWWFVGCGIGKIARARGRVRAGSRDSPQENHDLRSDLAHCALHLRDGYHDHHRAPLTSRDSSEPDCSPTKTEPSPCCVTRSRERFRQVSGLSAPRPLNERFVRRGRLLVAARERALAFSSAPSARRRLSRAISRSVSFK